MISGCSLANRYRAPMSASPPAYPGVPVVTTSTVGRREGRERHLLHVGQCRKWSKVSACARHFPAREYPPQRRGSNQSRDHQLKGPCEVHERFTAATSNLAQELSGVIVLAHPECRARRRRRSDLPDRRRHER